MVRMGRIGAVGVLLIGALAVVGCDGGVVKGSKGGLVATPSLLNYGPVALQHESAIEITVGNEGRAPLVVNELLPSVANVAVEGFDGPFTLSSGEARKFTVKFTPAVEGVVTGAVTVKTDSGDRDLQVAGVGVKAMVEMLPQRLDYGDVEIIAGPKMAEVNLHNPTEVAASVQLSIEGDDAEDFTSSLAGQTVVVEPSGNLAIPVAFKPAWIGIRSARLVAKVCDTCEPAVVMLSGTGITSIVGISPERLNFGLVSLGASADQKLTITNNGTEPLTLDAPTVEQDSAGVFEVTSMPTLTNNQLLAGQSAEVWVRFQPSYAGPVSGPPRLHVPVRASNSTGDGARIPLLGEGGSSCVGVMPQTLAFGTVPTGMSVTRRVDIINRCQGAVTVSNIQLTGVSGGFFSLGQAAATFNIPVGGVVPVKVTFTPKSGTTASSAKLEFIAFEGASQSTVTVPVTGDTRVFAPCQYTVTPPALDYGLVSVGSEVTLGFSIRNGGTDDCVVTGLDLVAGTDPQFTTTPVDSVTLKVGEAVTLPITFKPTPAGTYTGMAEAWVNNATSGHITVNLTGQGGTGCFTLQPSTVDFGAKKLSCGARTRTIVAFNNCTAPVTLTSAEITQATSNEYSLVNPPALPFTLAAGQSTAFTVNYVAVDDGEDVAALQVNAGQGGLQTAGIIGRGLSREDNTEYFQQQSQQKVDVLFVIDNSGSMMEEQQSLGSNFQAFLTAAQSQAIDYHIGVTTTGIEASPGGWSVCPGGAEGGEHGRLFPADNTSPRIITPGTPNAENVFKTNTNVGWCHWNEQGLEGAYRALTTPLVSSADDPSTTLPNDGNLGFLRPDAKLALIFISDEDDSSTQSVSYYETFFKAVKGNDPSLLSVSAIVGPTALSTCPTASSTGSRYIQLAQATGGVVESICTTNWAGSLQNLSNNAFGPKRHFPLSETPSDPSQIVVKVNGSQVTTGWTYDAATNTIVFDANAVPAAGATVEVSYPLGC